MLTQDEMSSLLFPSHDSNAQISIQDLRMIFEGLDVPSPKSLLIARYLIEPPMQGEVILNEQAKSTQGEIVRELKELIGHYRLY